MFGRLLLGALVLGLIPAGSTRTPSIYDEPLEDGSAGGTTGHPDATGGARPDPRGFPGQVSANDTTTLLLPNSSQALLLGWVPTCLVPAIYTVALVLGLPANGLALWVLATRVPRLPSTLLLMNLAAADLMLGLALPPRIAYHLRGQRWPFGETACRLATSALYGHMYCSLLLLAAVALDRYLAVVHPLRAPPLLAVTLCYGAMLRALAASGRQHSLALRLAALVLASALAFFVPSNVLLLLHYSDPRPGARGDLYAAYLPSLALSTLNSCVDPFIYYYVSADFREKVRRALGRPAQGLAGHTSKASGEGAGAGSHTRSTSQV
ncbi:proteinase-activated receptor 4 [Echinops telfairi]|uniref:Proteinase-activated receptor 4 n=1 Tax=Echinops telfairi TaxID=9371 RepID=A0AC55D1K1_ECHTE|nr:proteinase-activated receptor 4 [Echinops telfairi]